MPRTIADLIGTNSSTFRLGKPPTRATFDASGLTAPRTLTVQNVSGTLALTADVAAAQAAAIAYAVQRANHTGTQLAVTISDFASAVVAAGSGVWQPLSANLTGLASDYDAPTKALVCNHADAATVAGLHIGNNTHQDVALFGAGGGQGTTLYGQLNCLAIDSTSASGVLARTAATQDAIRLLGRAGGTSSRTLTLTTAALGADRTATFPDAAITVAGQNINNAFSAAQTINSNGTIGLDVTRAGTIGIRINSATTLGPAQLIFSQNGSQRGAFEVAADETFQMVGSTTAGKQLRFLIGPAFNTRLTINGDDGMSSFLGAGVTVPNGTAAAPGIRTTTYAHGLYSVDATNIGMSVAGALGLKVTKPNGSTIGSVLTLQSPSAGELAYFLNSADNSAFILAGGQSSTMGQVRLYGSAHATKAGYVEFTRGNTVSAYFNGSGNLICSGTVTVPNGTAAAPGIRTGEAHGFFRVGAASFGIAVAGVEALRIATSTGGTFRSGFSLASSDDAQPVWFCAKSEAQQMVCGGSFDAGLVGGMLRAYGNTHATKANYVEFTRGTTVSAYFDGSGKLTINGTTDGILTVAGKITAKVAVPGSFADLAAVQSYLASILT